MVKGHIGLVGKGHVSLLQCQLVSFFCQTLQVLQYFNDNWFNIGTMWANFGRQFNHEDSETTNLAERYAFNFNFKFPSQIAK